MGEIRQGSTRQFSVMELNRWITMQAENQQMRFFLSCRICRQNRISCVFQCGHLTCRSCSEPLVNCSICGTPITDRYSIYLHPP
ncbi:hypothetical protein ACJMK2_009481 [Sinanodonta woodiana]|uniref:RING-type domain-containing protein n=1 Tax=Sinanodonta woodiana TaxID=1069815 RepID=A0ABD3VCE2_SINWO